MVRHFANSHAQHDGDTSADNGGVSSEDALAFGSDGNDLKRLLA